MKVKRKTTIASIAVIFGLIVFISLGVKFIPFPPLGMILNPGIKTHDLILAPTRGRVRHIYKTCKTRFKRQIVIRTKGDLASFFQKFSGCQSFEEIVPNIEHVKFYKKEDFYDDSSGPRKKELNFSSYLVLGNYLAGGCGSLIFKTVNINHDDKTVIYKVAKKEYQCISGPGKGGMNFVAIKSLPADYKVLFVGTEK